MRTILLVDGENFKGKLKKVFEAQGRKRPQWHEFDFRGLMNQVLQGISVDRHVFYFAKVKEHPDTLKKSQELIEEQRELKNHLQRQGFDVVLTGRVRGQVEQLPGKKKGLVFKEKGVDVKIAVDMVAMACDKVADEIILASSDSDLQPAVSEVKTRGAKAIYLGFEINPNRGLSYTTGRTILIRNAEVIQFEKVNPSLNV